MIFSAFGSIQPFFCVKLILILLIAGGVFANNSVLHGDHPLKSDKTGINWVFSIQEARQIASEQNKIMFLKPAAGRSTEDSDHLSEGAEALRAAAFVDSRVVNFINRRFVPFYFDMDELGSAYSPEAVALVKTAFPELRFEFVMPTPPILLITPEGKLLDRASNYVSADELLVVMSRTVQQSRKYRELTEEENGVDESIGRAWIHYELRQFDKALEAIKDDQTSEAYYLRGIIARQKGDWTETRRSFRMVTDPQRKLDIMIEEALRFFEMRSYDGMKISLDGLNDQHHRYMEGMYLLGLAHYHSGEVAEAFKVWERAINHDRNHPWALRIDWTYGLAKLGPDQMVVPLDRPVSLLGRNYLTPNGNPDLELDR